MTDARERHAFKSWQFPASPDPNGHAHSSGQLGRIPEDDADSVTTTSLNGSPDRDDSGKDKTEKRTMRGYQHHPTSSMPYGALHRAVGAADDSPTAHRSNRSRMVSQPHLTRQTSYGLGRGGAGAGGSSMRSRVPVYVSYVFANLRRAKYNELCFGFVFFTSLLAFLSALGGIGYDDSVGAFAAPLVAPLARVGGGGRGSGFRALGTSGDRANADGQGRGYDPAELLRLLKPIPVPNEKDDEPLFADVLPGAKRRKGKKGSDKRKASPVAIAAVPEDIVTFKDMVGDGALEKAIMEARRRRLEGIPADAPLPDEESMRVGELPQDQEEEGEERLTEREHEDVHPDHVISDGTIAGHRGIFDVNGNGEETPPVEHQHAEGVGAPHDAVAADGALMIDKETVRSPLCLTAWPRLTFPLAQGHAVDRPYLDAHGLGDVSDVFEYDDEPADSPDTADSSAHADEDADVGALDDDDDVDDDEHGVEVPGDEDDLDSQRGADEEEEEGDDDDLESRRRKRSYSEVAGEDDVDEHAQRRRAEEEQLAIGIVGSKEDNNQDEDNQDDGVLDDYSIPAGIRERSGRRRLRARRIR